MPAIPRRTAGPKRRPAPESVEKVHPDGTISPPPAVMVADEEQPVPQSAEQLTQQEHHEEVAQGPEGMEGAKAAGIALAPEPQEREKPQMVPIHPPDESEPVPHQHVKSPTSPSHAILGLPKDEIELKHEHDAMAKEMSSPKGPNGPRPLPSPSSPIQMQSSDRQMTQNEADVPTSPARRSLPPPPMMTSVAPPVPSGRPTLPPVQTDSDEEKSPPVSRSTLPPAPAQQESDDEDVSPAAPLTRAGEESDDEAPPPPPMRQATLPPRPQSDSEDDAPPPPARQPTLVSHAADSNDAPPTPTRRAPLPSPPADIETDDEAPPPPQRQPALPSTIQDEAPPTPSRRVMPPILTGNDDSARPPTPMRQPTQPTISTPTRETPSRPIPPTLQTALSSESIQDQASPSAMSPSAEDDETARRKGIAARMAKLGGIKFGVPPPVPKVKRTMTTDSIEPASPGIQEAPAEIDSGPMSPAIVEESRDETPEQESERRRKTLARLRAGGTLGYGMFGQGGGGETRDDVSEQEEQEDEQAEETPPPPAVRPPPSPAIARPLPPPASSRPLPSAPSVLPPPPPAEQSDEEEEQQEADKPPIEHFEEPEEQEEEEEEAPPPPPPVRPMRTSSEMSSPLRTTSTREIPPVTPVAEPIEMSARPTPARIATNQPPSPSPRRSMSVASRQSFQSSPSSPVITRQESMAEGRPSMTGGRPGFNELQAASQDAGARVVRAAQALFAQGKRGYIGDGSPAGFVMVVYEQAHLPRPEQSWGQVVYEQESGSVLKKYDEPKPGDVAAFYDAKLKGKKGLSSYNQHVGSVQDPLVGIVTESEQKKHKLRVMQVERGVPEEVSYRCDDLKSGRIVVFRPM